MSMTTLCATAVQRDHVAPRRTVRKATNATAAIETEDQTYLNTLISAIPTEPLGLYTFLTAGIVGTIETGESERPALRWAIYGLMIVLIVVWLQVMYWRNSSRDADTRSIPRIETATAVVAFATWGLITPESPLTTVLEGDDRVVWTLIITAVGSALLALMGLWLNEEARR